MNAPRTRREFLAEVGRGMLVATVGYEVASGLGWRPLWPRKPTMLCRSAPWSRWSA